MSRTIELPDEVFRELERVANKRGVTPADWIAASIPEETGKSDETPLSGLLEGLIGAVDSAERPENTRKRTPFGDLVAGKLNRQGIRTR